MSTKYTPDKKRLAKNTIFLYIRMILLMVVSLYTSRVIFQSLGDVDYGLNNVISGFIGLFLILNATMSASTSRFLTYELGLQRIDRIKRVFSTAFNIHFLIASLVLLISESIGLWILNNVLVIPDDRLLACNIVYQITILCSVISICQVPFNSLIIAYEKMNMYAYMGILDALVKLMIAFSVKFTIYDKLVLLSIMQGTWTLATSFLYYFYSKKKWSEVVCFSKKVDAEFFRPMLLFAGYGFIGDLAYTLKSQGVSMLINVFFGAVVNAANAIAYQVNTAVCQFSNNFTMAIVPQITKAYSSGNIEGMKNLVFQGGKITFFLLAYLTLPIVFQTQYILELWLGDVPEYTLSFTRFVLALTLVESFNYTIGAAVKAQGNIKNYQLTVSGITLLTFPIAFVAYKWGAPPITALCTSLVLSTITLFSRLYFMKKLLSISPLLYFTQVLLRCFFVLIATVGVMLYVNKYTSVSFSGLLFTTFSIFLLLTFFILLIGVNKQERIALFNYVMKFINRNK